jgi:hypothetical protein
MVEPALMVEQVEMVETAAQVHRMESTAEMEKMAVIPIAPVPQVVMVLMAIVGWEALRWRAAPSRRTRPLKPQAAANTNPSFYFFDTLNLVNKTGTSGLPWAQNSINFFYLITNR